MDTFGLPHAIHITSANVTDRKGAEQMIGVNINFLSAVKVFLVDGGYSGNKFANTIKKIHGATVKLIKRNELHQDGSLNVLLVGLKSVAVFGKTVKDICTHPLK